MNVFRILLYITLTLILYYLWRFISLKLKSGVNLDGVSWRMFWAAIVAESIFSKYGATLTITSANDSKHMATSKHYSGEALDFRTWEIQGREPTIALALREKLGEDYDVVIESDHIHVEYDPV
jgi:hypothetical protein